MTFRTGADADGTIIGRAAGASQRLSQDFPEMSPEVATSHANRAYPQVSVALEAGQGPGGPFTMIGPLCAMEIATPTSEAAISTDQKMIAI